MLFLLCPLKLLSSTLNTEKNPKDDTIQPSKEATMYGRKDVDIEVSRSRLESSKIENSQMSGSKANESATKKKKKKVKKEEFDVALFNLINQVRQNPRSLVPEIEKAIQYIKPNPTGKGGDYVFEKEGHSKTVLLRGEEAFKEMADQLAKMPSLPSLKLATDLSIPVPEASADWTKREVIAVLINNLKQENGDKYNTYGFHFDLGMSDPVLSLVLQVVDDNNFKGQRRNNIFGQNFKSVGVSYKKVGKTKFCAYLTFAA